jgi:hypothetical protein
MLLNPFSSTVLLFIAYINIMRMSHTERTGHEDCNKKQKTCLQLAVLDC